MKLEALLCPGVEKGQNGLERLGVYSENTMDTWRIVKY